MKRYDFIIGYEHKNREIESICLLKYELERRGYSVLIYCTTDMRLKEHYKIYYAEVLLLPYANGDDVVSYSTYWAISFRKLINLQWEQAIYRQQEENPNSYRNPSGIGKYAVHLAWGKANERRLIQIAQIEPKNVKLTGNITLDFLRKPLSNYYMSKEWVYRKYNIPVKSKVCLFIASFKAATVEGEALDYLCELYGEWRREQHEVALKTMETILQWIERALEEDPELFFIYRPHPGEKTELPEKIERNCDRFRIIKELSVKQWILAVDRIYTWLSTTVVEVYFAQKNCYILYPYEVSKEAGGRLFDNMKCIKDYDTFLHSLNDENIVDFPVDIDIMSDYYLNDGKSYVKIVDVCEEILHSNDYVIESKELNRIYHMPKQSIFKKIWHYLWQIDWVYILFWHLVDKLSLNGNYFERKRIAREKYEKWQMEEYVSEKEIQDICNRIRGCLEQN